MKYIFGPLIIFLSLSLSAQDSCHLKRSQDPYTKEVKISSGFIPLQGGRVSIQATKTDIDFLFALDGGKCFDDGCQASVFYEGIKLKTNIRDAGPTNCNGIFHFTFRNMAGSPYALQNISSKKISSIKFKDNTGKETEVIFNADQQKAFMNFSACILTEAKTLLQ